MRLHCHVQLSQHADSIPVVLLHGLFGSYTNLNMLARGLKGFHCVQMDLRNHGQSEHTLTHAYKEMAADVIETLAHLKIKKCHVIGHSMGAKVAMQVAVNAPTTVAKLIALDMAPYAYTVGEHERVFNALQQVVQSSIQTRTEAQKILREQLDNEMVVQFLMKSFNASEWQFNVDVLAKCYANILSWSQSEPIDVPSLFIYGTQSPYVKEAQRQSILQQFPQAQLASVEAGHWLHAEKTAEVLEFINAFLTSNET